MRKYNVTVNGTSYEVMVEETTGTAAAPASPAQAAPAAPAAAPAPVASGSGETINSPMPGTILSIKVAAGQAVKSGETLMILEAMKMENEIVSPKDGTVTGISVSEGATVESGSLLCTIA